MDEVFVARLSLIEQLVRVLYRDRYGADENPTRAVKEFAEEVKASYRANVGDAPSGPATMMMEAEADRFFDVLIVDLERLRGIPPADQL